MVRGSKNWIGIGFAFVALVLLCSGMASAERIDIPHDYASIQAGLNHASPGDTIYVHAGTYHEHLSIFTSNLTLVGEDAIIDGGGYEACIHVHAKGVKISGFKVQRGERGIWLEDAASCVISNNTVINNRGKGSHEGHGIGLTSSSNCIIANNTVLSNSAYGIALFQSNNNIIKGNRCDSNRDYQINLFTASCNNTITENSLSGSIYGHGIYLIGQSNNNVITKNVAFSNSNAGINVLSSHHNLISDNILEYNVKGLWIGSMLSFDYSNGNIIANNTVSSNTDVGILVENGNENEIINNSVTGDKDGIHIRKGNRNRIYHNHLKNGKNAYDGESNRWDNGYPSGGNYWSDYPGSDKYMGVGQDEPGNDSIGDTPYIIDGNSRDNYPFIWIYIPPITISDVCVSPAEATIGTPINVCANVSAISGVDNGGVIAKFMRGGYKVKQIYMTEKEGIYCGNWYLSSSAVPGVYHVDVAVTDREGRVMESEDAATFEIIGRKSSSLIVKAGLSNPLDKNGDRLEDSLERILGDKSINVIVMHDKKYSTNRYAPFGEVKASFDTLNGCAIRTSAVNLTAISNLSGVEMVYEDKEVHTCLDSALLEIKAKEVVTGAEISGGGVTIALIDTGIDANHECLDDLDDDPETKDPKLIAFMDFVNGKKESYDDNGHGTHCAAVAAGTGGKSKKYVGVAPGANLVGVKALDSRGNGYISDVISGIEWCMREKGKYNIKVISLSLGGDENSDGSTPLEQACDNAVDAGLVVCVAAGNAGSGYNKVGIPGCAKKVITVGAVDDNGKIADFSSWGSTSDDRLKPDLCAAGVDITAAKANSDQRYNTRSGTSMATPEVAGAAALLLQCNSSLTPTEIKSILLETAEDKWPTGPDKKYGYGVLDVESAVNRALSKSGPSPLAVAKLNMSGNVTVTAN
jgi:serine protease AprX